VRTKNSKAESTFCNKNNKNILIFSLFLYKNSILTHFFLILNIFYIYLHPKKSGSSPALWQ